MPTITENEPIVVPIPQSTRSDVYYQMGMDARLIREPHRAAAIAREFYNAVRPIEFEAGTPLSEVRAHTVFGNVQLTQLPIDLAEWFTNRDTRGRAHLETFNGTQVRLIPNGSLDKRAWESYNKRPSSMYGTSDSDGGLAVSVQDLDHTLTVYRNYAVNDRMKLIRKLVNMQLATPVEDTTKKPVRSGGGDFLGFFEKFQQKLLIEDNPFQDLPILPHGTLSSRRWGIEIEAVDLGGIKTPKYWVLKGDGSLRSEPNRAMPAHLDTCLTHEPPVCGHSTEVDGCTNDCNCGYEQSTTGQTATGEWNSPVLRSFHSKGLEHICKELEGRQTNYSAGVHVHVSAGDLTPEQASVVSLLYTAFEPLFEAEYHRETRDYCRTLESDTVLYRLKEMRQHQRAHGRTALRNAPGGERYSTVNLCALQSHGTIEFRAMGNVYDYEKLVRWAAFLRELLNMAKSGVPQKEWGKVKTFKDVVVLMSKYGRETPTPPWAPDEAAISPVERLGRENRRTPNRITSHPDGVADVFEDYSATEYVLTDTHR